MWETYNIDSSGLSSSIKKSCGVKSIIYLYIVVSKFNFFFEQRMKQCSLINLIKSIFYKIKGFSIPTKKNV